MKKLHVFLIDYPIAVLLISILTSVLVGFITSTTYALSAIESIIIGFLSLVILTLMQISVYSLQLISTSSSQSSNLSNMNELIHFNNNLDKLNREPTLKQELINIVNKTEQAITALTATEVDSKLDQLFKDEIGRQLNRSREALEELQSGTLRVVGDEAHPLWSRVIDSIEESFFTTNIYRFRGVLLGARSTQHILSLQGEVAKRIEKGKFERLFVYEVNDEKEVAKTIDKQKGIGIKAWSIKRDEFDKMSRDGSWIERIGSDDFTIIDNKYLYLSTIDPRTERVLYVDLYRGGVRLTAAIEFANKIRDIQKLFLEEDNVEIPS